jgi:hypothetical protein
MKSYPLAVCGVKEVSSNLAADRFPCQLKQVVPSVWKTYGASTAGFIANERVDTAQEYGKSLSRLAPLVSLP